MTPGVALDVLLSMTVLCDIVPQVKAAPLKPAPRNFKLQP